MDKIRKGLEIIAKYEETGDFSAGHDQILCGDDNGKAVTDMSDEDKKQMDALGWFVDVDFDCWSHFC